MNWQPDFEEYPFQSNYFLVNGNKLHYIDEGEGPVLLFVHGTPSWSFDFRHIIKAFQKEYRCIAIDHLGFGLSDKPEQYRYSTIGHSDVLTQFIEKKNLKNIIMVVHDFGGPIGLSSAIKNPELFSGFVILNSWLWSSENEPEFIRLKRVLQSPLLPILYKYFNFSARYILPKSFGEKKISKRILQQYKGPFEKVKHRGGTIAFANSLLRDQQWFEGLWTGRESISKKPVLFIWGMRDPVLLPKYLTKFASGFQNSTIAKLDSTGHFPQEENPDEVISHIRNWLNKL